MKYRTTRKAIVEGTPRKDLFAVGYCNLAHLLSNHQPIAYTCGIYGWNFDVYAINGKTICTGYRNMPGRQANNVTEYERRARAIHDDYSRRWEDRSAEIEALLVEFLEQA